MNADDLYVIDAEDEYAALTVVGQVRLTYWKLTGKWSFEVFPGASGVMAPPDEFVFDRARGRRK